MLPYLKDLSTPEAAGSQGTSMDGIFPIPLPPGKWTLGGEKHEEWGEGIIRSLNWLATGSFAVGKGVPTRQQIRLVDQLRENMKLFDYWSNVRYMILTWPLFGTISM